VTRTGSPVIGEPSSASEGRRVQRRLAEAEATIQALLSGQIDAVVDATNPALLDIAHEAILVKDLDGRILYWNKGAEKTFGWSAAETLGRKAEDFLHTGAIGFHNARTASPPRSSGLG
jgi:PAS domain-containing protein